MKHRDRKTPLKVRSEMAVIERDKSGRVILMCPFCVPSHPLNAYNTNACGSRVEMRVTQTIFKATYSKNMVCAKCAKGGGEMVMFNNAFIHTNDCTPGVATLSVEPDYSIMASLIYRLPDKIRKVIEKMTGEVKQADQVTPEGIRTGVVLGHFFHRRKNGKHPKTIPG